MTSLGWEDDGAQEGLMLRRSVEKCLTEAEIDEYLASRLSGVTREVIEEHLLVCTKCLDCVEQEEEFAEAFRSAALREEAAELERSYGEPAAGPPATAPTEPSPDAAPPPRGVSARLWNALRRRGLRFAWILVALGVGRS